VHIINKDHPWIVCKRCGSAFKAGNGSCKCGSVTTETSKEGYIFIEESGDNIAVIDTE